MSGCSGRGQQATDVTPGSCNLAVLGLYISIWTVRQRGEVRSGPPRHRKIPEKGKNVGKELDIIEAFLCLVRTV